MKKLTLIFITMLFSLFIDQTYAQIAKSLTKNDRRTEKNALKRLEPVKVSEVSKQSFDTDFGDINNVIWFRADNYDKAIFNKDGHQLNAYYDKDGQLVGTTSLKTFADLPKQGQLNLRILFRNFTVEQIVFFNNNPGNKTPMVLWGSEIDDNTTYLVQLKYGFRKFIVYMDPGGKVSLFKVL